MFLSPSLRIIRLVDTDVSFSRLAETEAPVVWLGLILDGTESASLTVCREFARYPPKKN